MADRLFGKNGDDRLFGGDGRDFLAGGRGRDVVTGGEGADTFGFGANHMVDWDGLSGSTASKFGQLDLITDFTPGQDRIRFDNMQQADRMSDLSAQEVALNGNDYFVVAARSTNERILVDVDDSVTQAQFFDSGNFLFT